MPEENEEWTPGQRKLWRETWEQPHMQLGLKVLMNRIKPKPLPIVPGHDALVLAAGAFHSLSGKHDVLDEIKNMGREEVQRKPMPDPWTPEALRGLNETEIPR